MSTMEALEMSAKALLILGYVTCWIGYFKGRKEKRKGGLE